MPNGRKRASAALAGIALAAASLAAMPAWAQTTEPAPCNFSAANYYTCCSRYDVCTQYWVDAPLPPEEPSEPEQPEQPESPDE